ncbi:hypothetical protein ES703_78902 [subsurface metagenome]
MQFKDIPVPTNFKHQPKESIVFADAHIRTAYIKYVSTGFVRMDDVIEFYEKQMPLHGWEKNFERPEGWQTTIFFTKKHEECEVVIDKSGDKIDLIIEISAD